MNPQIKEAIRLAIAEDAMDPTGKIPFGDHSSLSCLTPQHHAAAKLWVKDSGILAGIDLAGIIFKEIDPELQVKVAIPDGASVAPGMVALEVEGRALSILQAERLVLNFMQRMSGIATLTDRYVQAIAGTSTTILDTRKTTPGFRLFEKWAVRLGGGSNHRFGLYDMIMLKDNHVDFCGGIRAALDRALEYRHKTAIQVPIEIETRNLKEVMEALQHGGADRIMLDNFSVAAAAEAVSCIGGKAETEISGGINLNTVRAYAETGVDFISVGALTHSYTSLDLSLKAKLF